MNEQNESDESRSQAVSALMGKLIAEVKAGRRSIEGVLVDVYALGMRHGGTIMQSELTRKPEAQPAECSICRKVHGKERVHACE